MLLVGCAAGREMILSRTMAGMNAAEKAFVAWDAHHQIELVEAAHSREDGEVALVTYRAKRDHVVKGMIAAYSALAVASVDLEGDSLAVAARATAAVLAGLRNLGVFP
jgi:hypothetical protein